MTSNLTNLVDDEMLLISHYYPTSITDLPPLDHPPVIAGGGEGKTRRRRKKSRGGGGEDGNGSGGGGFRKRKLNQEQVNLLEQSFEDEHKLESERKDKLASELGLDSRQVAVWFQNRRARWKNKKLEEEYSRLKTEHDSTVIEKCRLESEVMKLKEQLSESEKEMQRLLENSYNSPSSSFSMDTMEIMPPFLGEFGMEGLENVLYVPQSNYIIPGLEWANLYI